MAKLGKEYQLAIKISGEIEKSLGSSLTNARKMIQQELGTLDKDFTKLDKGFDSIIGGLEKVGEVAAVAGGAIATGLGAAIKIGSDFEAQMSTVEAISGATSSEMEQLKEAAKDMAASTTFDATQMGEAFEYMGMAGWKAQEMLNGLPGIVHLAAASGEDLGAVSDIVTDALTAFGLTAADATHFADVLAATATNANTNISMMGEAFQYVAPVAGAMSYSIEDISLALGLMANSGIKASMAGTSLRNVMQRMAKPTKESGTAMDELGLSLTDANGNLYSFYEIMQQLRSSMSGTIKDTDALVSYMNDLDAAFEEGTLSEEAYTEALNEYIDANTDVAQAENLKLAAMLAGARGMSGLLAIVNSSTEDFEKLAGAIDNSTGAAERMSNTRLDNLAGDMELLSDAAKDLGISVYEEMAPGLRDAAQYATEAIGGIKGDVVGLVGDVTKELPTLKRKFDQYAGPVFDTLEDAFSWLTSHGDDVAGVIVGIGGALATYKVVSTTVHFATALSGLAALSPVTVTLLGIAGGIGAIAGIVAKNKMVWQGMVDNNLAEHFGEISLSLDEVQKAAERIVTSKSLNEVNAALVQFDELSGIADTINGISEALEKTEWKVSIGMNISEDELSNYRASIDNFIQESQAYVEQAQIAATLSMTAALSDETLEKTNIISALNNFYSDKQEELSSLGKQLNDAVTAAFQDGFLDFDEAETIANLRAKIAEVEAALAQDEFKVSLDTIIMDEGGYGNLDAESFQNVMVKTSEIYSDAVHSINDNTSRAMHQAEQIKQNAQTTAESLRDAFQNHLISAEEYGQRMTEASQALASANGALDAAGADADMQKLELAAYESTTLLGTITTQYSDTLKSAMDVLDDISSDAEKMANFRETGMSYVYEMMSGIISPDDAGAISELLTMMNPVIEDMRELKKKLEEEGREVPESLVGGINEYDLLSALTGNGDGESMLETVSSYLTDSEDFNATLEAAHEAGVHTDESIAEGMVSEEALAVVQDGVNTVYGETEGMLSETFAEGFSMSVPLNLAFDVSMGGVDMTGINKSLLGMTSGTVPGHADGAIVNSPEIAAIAERGPEAVIPLDGSSRAQALWETAGQYMNMESRAQAAADDESIVEPTTNINYSPVYHFEGTAAPTQEDLSEANRMGQRAFEQMYKQMVRNQTRASYSGVR